MTERKLYTQRRGLRRLEALWTGGERVLDRLTGSFYNPLYHTGTLAIFLLAVIIVTGAYLTIFYRPGMERAFATVDGMTVTWLGSLMRTLHRYASDALIVVSMTHVIKIFVADRFWGSRWLAWVSGWGLMALFWIVGVMGYWLVWDKTAQWITEYAMTFSGGASSLSFFSTDPARATFSFFVIILFLHVFLAVIIGLGLVIHNARLQRTRWWPPRWVWAGSLLTLVAVAVLRPAERGVEADFSQLVDTVELDWWYLFFLPLSELLGSTQFWIGLVSIFVVAVGLPWLLRGGVAQAAVVIEDACTGCVRCEVACPYEAIEMRPRSGPDSLPLAVVNEGLCTACGLCVAVCPTKAIELPGQTTDVILDGLAAALATTDRPTVLFTCERHLVMGSVPGVAPGDIPPSGITVTSWTGDGGGEHPLVACLLPCSGMTNVRWLNAAHKGGASSVATLSCPTDDCRFREGPKWPAQAFGRGWLKRTVTAGRLDAAPGDRRMVRALLNRVHDGQETEERKAAARRTDVAKVVGSVLVATVLLVAVTVLPVRPGAPDLPSEAMLRLTISHRGDAKEAEADPDLVGSLPEGVDLEDVVGGERYPVELHVVIDGEVSELSLEPTGLRGGGKSFGLETWWLEPGPHDVVIRIADAGPESFRTVFDEVLTVGAGRSVTLVYDAHVDGFVTR